MTHKHNWQLLVCTAADLILSYMNILISWGSVDYVFAKLYLKILEKSYADDGAGNKSSYNISKLKFSVQQ